MPTLVKKRGREVWIARPYYRGQRGPTKLMPDNTKRSYRKAIAWEDQQKELMKQAAARMTATAFLTLKQWSDEYLDYARKHFVKKTYQEKRDAFKRLVMILGLSPQSPVHEIDRFKAVKFFNAQFGDRSGHAVNKDRKNLGAAWRWGQNFLEMFPRGENSFLVVPKKPEVKKPRYVPALDDFYTVYDHVAGVSAESGDDVDIQDRVMLLAYLHLAGRRSELFRVDMFEDLDLANSRIRLSTRKRNGGLEYDWLPMTYELHAEMVQWVERRISHSTPNKSNLFVCLDERPCNDQYYGQPFIQRRHIMAKWCKRADVKPFGWHAIRHLTAHVLYLAGYPANHIQEVLRHRLASTTNIYLRSLGICHGLRQALNDGLKRNNVIEFKQKKASGQ